MRVEILEEQNDDKESTEEINQRIKANRFFLVGSILYLPPTISDVLDVYHSNKNGNVDDDDGASSSIVYYLFLVLAALSYMANGLTEAKMAYADYKYLRHEKGIQYPPRGDLINGVIFAIAALNELLSVVTGDPFRLGVLLCSTHLYLLNAMMTLFWLRRAASSSVAAQRWIQVGDSLFLVGALLDLTGSYMELASSSSSSDDSSSSSEMTIAWLWLISALAWFLDAICYVLADHHHHSVVVLNDVHNIHDSHNDSSSSSNNHQHEGDEAKSLTETELPGKRLSSVV
jgi:hypothetical protein